MSDEGACVSGGHRILLKHSLWPTKHNGVMETPELCLLCASYLRPGAWPENGSCSPQGQVQVENSSDPTPRDRAEPLVPECLRRFLGSSSFPPPSPFSPPCAGRPGGAGIFCFLPFRHCCLFGLCLFGGLLPFSAPSSSRCLLRWACRRCFKHFPSLASPKAQMEAR